MCDSFPHGWLESLSSARASPAAGSAAALAGALGVALLIKLARLSSPGKVPNHAQCLEILLSARQRLLELAEMDAVAVRGWVRVR